mgnify:CR=1 FL=1|jgi:hypothetical protein
MIKKRSNPSSLMKKEDLISLAAQVVDRIADKL